MIILDGYNLIGRGRALGLALDDLDKERRLLNLVGRWRARKGVRQEVRVIFDGREVPPAGGRERGGASGLRAIYTSGGSADSYIGDLVRKDPHPRWLTVVSSDRAVQREARMHAARVLDAEEFLAGIARVLGPGESEKPERAAPADVEELLRLFSEKKEAD